MRIDAVHAHPIDIAFFADFDQNLLVQTAEDCGEVLSADGGLDHVLVLIRANLPPKLRETAYAVALEVAAADLDIRPEETRFLELLRDALDLSITALREIIAVNLDVRARALGE